MSKFLKVGSAIGLGSMSIVVMSALTGCSAPQEEAKNRFLIIEQDAMGKYTVVEEVPTDGPSRAIIRERDENGRVTERLMSEAEMKALAQDEYNKVQAGTSETTQQHSGGMGLGGTILAVAAGSLLGNMIANQLMGNKNFSQNSNRANKSAYHANKKAGRTSSKKKSFFSKKSSSSGRTSGWGG